MIFDVCLMLIVGVFNFNLISGTEIGSILQFIKAKYKTNFQRKKFAKSKKFEFFK